MIEWTAGFVGGLLGSAHCVGMCGGIALTVGSVPVARPSPGQALRRQLIYSAGRISTYVFLGALAAHAGVRLSRLPEGVLEVQRVFSIIAGVLMILLGISILGWLPWRPLRLKSCGNPITATMSRLVSIPGRTGSFLAGLGTGFLPCGLVYAFLAQAVAEADVARGVALMFFFGLGTLPAMLVVGCGGGWLAAPVRAKVFRVAAGFVVLVGGLTVYRGWQASAEQPCPGCASAPSDRITPAGSPETQPAT